MNSISLFSDSYRFEYDVSDGTYGDCRMFHFDLHLYSLLNFRIIFSKLSEQGDISPTHIDIHKNYHGIMLTLLKMEFNQPTSLFRPNKVRYVIGTPSIELTGEGVCCGWNAINVTKS